MRIRLLFLSVLFLASCGDNLPADTPTPSPLVCGQASMTTMDLSGSTWAVAWNTIGLGTWHSHMTFTRSASGGLFMNAVMDCPAELQAGGCLFNGRSWNVSFPGTRANGNFIDLFTTGTTFGNPIEFQCNWDGTSTFNCSEADFVDHEFRGGSMTLSSATGLNGHTVMGAKIPCPVAGVSYAGAHAITVRYSLLQQTSGTITLIDNGTPYIWGSLSLPGSTLSVYGQYEDNPNARIVDLMADGAYGQMGPPFWMVGQKSGASVSGSEFAGPFREAYQTGPGSSFAISIP